MILAQEEYNPVLPHTSEIIIGLIAFLLLLFVMTKFVKPRFEKLYEERAAKIEGASSSSEGVGVKVRDVSQTDPADDWSQPAAAGRAATQ